MLLLAHSDASYLSRANSGSVAGGFHFLGKENGPTFFNAPIFCVSTLIPVIVAAVSEAEYAAVFGNAQYACDERSILASLGYIQPPTTILCDNECAIGLANKSIQPKMSKSINMRLHWVQDRVKLNHFRVVFVPGVDNLADFLQNHCLYTATTNSLPIISLALPSPVLQHYVFPCHISLTSSLAICQTGVLICPNISP